MYDLPENVSELLLYLPVEDQSVTDYTDKLCSAISSNYEKQEYQFAYFAAHLIFMTFIYSMVWKISRHFLDRYKDSTLFARPYRGDSSLDLHKLNSIFDFSRLPEKDIFNFFRLIDMDKGYIESIKNLIDTRNDMAHATGNLQIYTLGDFNDAMHEILVVSDKILRHFEKPLKAWYENECLLKYALHKINEYPEPKDFISEEIIAVESLSINELKICCNMGISKFKDWKKYPLLNNSHNSTIKDFQFAINIKLSELLEGI